MITTCKVEAKLSVGGKVMKHKSWPACDVMKTGITRGWATRQFNAFLKDLNECSIGKDKIIVVEWSAYLGGGRGTLRGLLSGVNGKVMARRGIFER